jgi:hypothetical protein
MAEVLMLSRFFGTTLPRLAAPESDASPIALEILLGML